MTYGTVGDPYSIYLFVISWNGIPNKGNNNKQSFQVVIAPIGFAGTPAHHHNRIWFNYKSITKDYSTVVGVENIVGDRGSSYNFNSLTNNSALEVRYPFSGCRLERLTIKLSKSDVYAKIGFVKTDGYDQIGGHNVVLKDSTNPFADYFKFAIQNAAALLITGEAGYVMGIVLIGWDLASILARELSPPVFEVQGADQNASLAYVRSQARDESYGEAFDASLSAGAIWFFTDPNERSHSLTITTELEYVEYQDDLPYDYYTISTSVSLNMYVGGDVGPSTSEYATWWPHQRKTFYAAGRYWAFYSNGSYIVYKTSTNGWNWTSPMNVRYGTSGIIFSVWFDGQYVHYACQVVGYLTAWLMYRRGSPQSNGSIIWSAEQTVASGSYAYADPFVSVDSNGYPWIAYVWGVDASTYYPCVVKSALNNGLWTTASGFPYQLSTTSTPTWRTAAIPLTSGKMLAIYARTGDFVRSRRWSGSSWSTEAATSNTIAAGWGFSAVNQGDNVHLVLLKYGTYDIIYTKYSYNTWGTVRTVQPTTTSLSAPVLCINRTNNNLYCFWAGSPISNHIYYKKYSSGTWDTSPTDWIDESAEVLTSNDRLTCFYEAGEGRIGLLYMTRTFNPSIPYDVEYAVLW